MSIIRRGLGMIAALAAAMTGKAEALQDILKSQDHVARVQSAYIPKRRRGISAKSPEARMRGMVQGPPRYGRARGPHTINAKADGIQLARHGAWARAAEMLHDVASELAARYRGFATHPETVPAELGNTNWAWPFNGRFIP